jgi:RimJ/RimL family protein N-acetyltransferase
VLELRTARLRLRPWAETDRLAFHALHADPAVMEFFPSVLGPEQCDALIARNASHVREHGFGLWSVDVVGGKAFIGHVGLTRTTFDVPFTPCVEVSWMLARDAWGYGYAVEAARAVCRAAFGVLGLEQLVSFTVPGNVRSRRVMERLGMVRDPTMDFEHPRLPDGHRLRRHVLYRMTASQWSAAETAY